MGRVERECVGMRDADIKCLSRPLFRGEQAVLLFGIAWNEMKWHSISTTE